MPALSRSQQALMGQVYGVRKWLDSKGKNGLNPKDINPEYRKKIVDMAKGWEKKKSLKDYASTKHKGLPPKISESFDTEKLSFLIGKPINLIKILHTTGKYDPISGQMSKVKREEKISARIKGFDDEGGYSVPCMTISRLDSNNTIGRIMWDKKSNEFVEGDSSFHYTYEPESEVDMRNLELFKNNFYDIVGESEVPTIYPYLNPDAKKPKKKSKSAKMQNLADYREFISKINK
jgi:hypothetical protein